MYTIEYLSYYRNYYISKKLQKLSRSISLICENYTHCFFAFSLHDASTISSIHHIIIHYYMTEFLYPFQNHTPPSWRCVNDVKFKEKRIKLSHYLWRHLLFPKQTLTFMILSQVDEYVQSYIKMWVLSSQQQATKRESHYR